MAQTKLTDRETAVVIDALAAARDAARQVNVKTPNIDAALAKINGLITPSTDGLTITADG